MTRALNAKVRNNGRSHEKALRKHMIQVVLLQQGLQLQQSQSVYHG